jgi:hypothetical protein
MSRARIFSAVSAVTLCWGLIASGANAADTAAAHHVKVFIGACALAFPNIDLIAEQAGAAGFQELSGAALTMGRPMDDVSRYQGWSVRDEGEAPLFLGISQNDTPGKMSVACSVVGKTQDADEIAKWLVQTRTVGRQVDDVVDVGQRYRVWRSSQDEPGTTIYLTDGSPVGVDVATISIIKQWK